MPLVHQLPPPPGPGSSIAIVILVLLLIILISWIDDIVKFEKSERDGPA